MLIFRTLEFGYSDAQNILLTASPYRNEKLLADPVRLRQISERIPAGRWGQPVDFAGPVVFLASKASQYVCGELVAVDGVRACIVPLSEYDADAFFTLRCLS